MSDNIIAANIIAKNFNVVPEAWELEEQTPKGYELFSIVSGHVETQDQYGNAILQFTYRAYYRKIKDAK